MPIFIHHSTSGNMPESILGQTSFETNKLWLFEVRTEIFWVVNNGGIIMHNLSCVFFYFYNRVVFLENGCFIFVVNHKCGVWI